MPFVALSYGFDAQVSEQELEWGRPELSEALAQMPANARKLEDEWERLRADLRKAKCRYRDAEADLGEAETINPFG